MTDMNKPNDQQQQQQQQQRHANPHISSFLALPMMELDNPRGIVQVIRRGSDLTADNLRHGLLSIDRPIVVTDTPESIGMTVPPRRDFTIQDVAEKIGYAYPVRVLDVELQTEIDGWTIGNLVEYFHNADRLCRNRGETTTTMTTTIGSTTPTTSSLSSSRRPRRAAALQSEAANTRHPVLNQLSLEFSRTAMGPPFIQSPQFVRDLDWIDLCWPNHWRRKLKYPMVQYYCLTSAQGAWTDFHQDMGGTSVWYHILDGAKEFCLIPPTAVNLDGYQQWLNSKHQDADFLPDNLTTTHDDDDDNKQPQVYKIRLEAHQTLVIPCGWIHAVYTPLDSLVLGGNFLHGLAIHGQLQVAMVEETSRIPEEMRFPYFRQLHVCAAGYYYEQLLESGRVVEKEKEGLAQLVHQVETWVYQDGSKQGDQPTVQQMAQEIAKKHKFASFGAFLDDIRRLLTMPVPVIRTDIQSAVTKSRVPRIRLRTKTQSAATAESAAAREEEEEEPRIRLSQPQRALPIPAKMVASRKREDVASYVVQDEEWTPSSSSPKRATSKRARSTEESSARAKKPSSARNRLMKKLK